MLNQLGLISDIAPNEKPVFEIDNPYFEDQVEYIYIYQSFIVIYREGTKPFMGEYLKNQLELPIAAANWIVDAVENGFKKKPSEGGLPKDVFNMSSTIDSEELYIRWGVSVAGEGIGGYTIKNFDRSGYIDTGNCQKFSIAHDIMDEQILPLLKDIAKKHQAGEL